MIDVHSHILHRVDDGPSDIADSVRIIEKGAGEGIGAFVITPHVKSDRDWKRSGEIRSAFEELKAECVRANIRTRLVLGAEVLITPNLAEMVLCNADVTFGGRVRHLLVELPAMEMPIYADAALFEILVKGITPIIAHVERYRYLRSDTARIKKWIDSGVLMQVNAPSLTGRHGLLHRWHSRRLLKKGLVQLLGSDVHEFREKLSLHAHAMRIITDVIGPQKAEAFFLRQDEYFSYLDPNNPAYAGE